MAQNNMCMWSNAPNKLLKAMVMKPDKLLCYMFLFAFLALTQFNSIQFNSIQFIKAHFSRR